MNFLHRLGSAYFEPAKTSFQVINKKPAWFAIFLISALLSVAGEYVANLRVDMAGIARKSLESMPVKLSEKQLNQIEEQAIAQQNKPIFRVLGLLQRPTMSMVASLVTAGIYLLMFSVLQSPLKYQKVFAVTIWGFTIPSLIQQIISMFILFLKEPYTVDPREGIVMSHLGFIFDSKAHPFLHSLATSLDLFSIWTIILLAIGFSAISENKLTRGKAATAILILWGILVIGSAGVRTVIAGLGGISGSR